VRGLQGMDYPTLYCLGTVKVGYAYSTLSKSETWKHSPDGLFSDGGDLVHITNRLDQVLEQALRDREADLEFKALAICSMDEIKLAQEALLAAAKRDREEGEKKAAEALGRVYVAQELPPPEWRDLDQETLGEVAVTEEVLELHECARSGNTERMRWLLQDCTEQHYTAVNARYSAEWVCVRVFGVATWRLLTMSATMMTWHTSEAHKADLRHATRHVAAKMR
jgi:hypothetical protein